MPKSKKAVKKGSCNGSPADKLLEQITRDIKIFNQLYSNGNDRATLHLTSEYNRRIEAIKILAVTEQKAADVFCLTMRKYLKYGSERIRRMYNNYKDEYRERSNFSWEDKATDPDAWYSKEVFESNLKDALGKYYVPPEERYDKPIFYNGTVVARTNPETEREISNIIVGQSKKAILRRVNDDEENKDEHQR